MTQLKYKDQTFPMTTGKSVLDVLLENEHDISNNCRAGACQACIMRLTKGTIPPQAQKGLTEAQKAKGLFLACSCEPKEDIEVQSVDFNQYKIPAEVVLQRNLSDDVVELIIKTKVDFKFFPGQFINLWKDEHLGRSYSIASLSNNENLLSFHIKLIKDGQFSGWVHNELKKGDSLLLEGPMGDCFYTPEAPEKPLLLVGTGTGLAPLFAIVNDALAQGHQGDIHLVHGGLNTEGLYLIGELLQLQRDYPNFNYHACVLHAEDQLPEHIKVEDISSLSLKIFNTIKTSKVYLCGNPELVKRLQKTIFLAGCDMKNIYSDPFIYQTQ